MWVCYSVYLCNREPLPVCICVNLCCCVYTFEFNVTLYPLEVDVYVCIYAYNIHVRFRCYSVTVFPIPLCLSTGLTAVLVAHKEVSRMMTKLRTILFNETLNPSLRATIKVLSKGKNEASIPAVWYRLHVCYSHASICTQILFFLSVKLRNKGILLRYVTKWSKPDSLF